MHLKYYIFDWDDNILHMPTVIWMTVEGRQEAITTRQFAKIRKDPRYQPINGDWKQALRDFGDVNDDKIFARDVAYALDEGAFAPSFETFKQTLINGSLFCIISARSHVSATLRVGVEKIIATLNDEETATMVANVQHFNTLAGLVVGDDDCIARYLDLNGYIGVSAPHFNPGNIPVEELKIRHIRQFIDHVLYHITQLKGHAVDQIYFGFSDDDPHNVERVQRYMTEECQQAYPTIKFRIFDTSTGSVQKIRI